MGLHLVQLLFQRLDMAASRIEPVRIARETQISVPGFDGVHPLAAIFHDHCFVEEQDWIAGSHFVGAAQVVEGRGAVVFAAGGRAALKVGRSIVQQETGSYGSGGDQPVENVDGRIESLFEKIGAGIQLEPVRIAGSAFQLALDCRTGFEEARGFAAGSAAAEVSLRSHFGKTGARDAQLEDAGVGIGLCHQPLRAVRRMSPKGKSSGQEQRCRQGCSGPEVDLRQLAGCGGLRSAGKTICKGATLDVRN